MRPVAGLTVWLALTSLIVLTWTGWPPVAALVVVSLTTLVLSGHGEHAVRLAIELRHVCVAWCNRDARGDLGSDGSGDGSTAS